MSERTVMLNTLASGQAKACYDDTRQRWLIQNTGNVALRFEGRDGTLVTIQPGEEKEV